MGGGQRVGVGGEERGWWGGVGERGERIRRTDLGGGVGETVEGGRFAGARFADEGDEGVAGHGRLGEMGGGELMK